MGEKKKIALRMNVAGSSGAKGSMNLQQPQDAASRQSLPVEESQRITSFALKDVDSRLQHESSEIPSFEGGDDDGGMFEASRNNSPSSDSDHHEPEDNNQMMLRVSEAPFQGKSEGEFQKERALHKQENEQELRSIFSGEGKDNGESKDTGGKLHRGSCSTVNSNSDEADIRGSLEEILLQNSSKSRIPAARSQSRNTTSRNQFTSDFTLQLAQSDPYLERRKRILSIVAVLLISALGYVGYRMGLHEHAMDIIAGVQGGTYEQSGHSAKLTRSKPVDLEVERRILRGDCLDITRIGLTNVTSSTVSPRSKVRIANCFYAANNSLDANMMLRPLKVKLGRIADKALDRNLKFIGYRDAYLLSLQILLSQGRYEDAEVLVKKRCPNWKADASCLGKLMYLAGSEQLQSALVGHRAMSAGVKSFPRLLKAYYYFVGGSLALGLGARTQANERFRLASRAAPSGSQALVRGVFLAWSRSLYKMQSSSGLTKVISRARKISGGVDERMVWRPSLYKRLLNSDLGKHELQNFFTNSALNSRVRTDFKFAESIGINAIKFGLASEYRTFLVDMLGELRTKNHADSAVIARIDLWRIRTIIAQLKYEESFKEIQKHQKKFGDTYLTRYISGLSYMAMNPHRKYQSLAARDFRVSLRLRSTWQGYGGLALAKMRAGDTEGARKPLRMLGKIKKTGPMGRRWYKLIQAEYYVASRDYRRALKFADRILAENGNSSAAWAIKADAYRGLFQRRKAADAQRRSDDIGRSASKMTTVDGVYSPLGSIVFAK